MLIKYISDLHLDYKSPQKKRDFLKLLNPNMFYIIAGDFYNDYRKTLSLIDELNAKKIHGYWVMGNHEYIYLNEPGNIDPKKRVKNDELYKIQSNKIYDNFLANIKNKTKKYKYFKLLSTGMIVKLGKWILIGDTGWSSFKFNDNKPIDDHKKYSWNHLNNWNWVKKEHDKFIKFANNVIKKYNNILIVTHHPMYFPDIKSIANSRLKDKQKHELLFWFSKGEIKNYKQKNIHFIHGHTHTEPFLKKHYSNAIGRHGHEIKLEFKTLNLP